MTAAVTKFPPVPMPPSGMGSRAESHKIVRERTFSSREELAEIVRELRESTATGTLFIDINQGGVGTIRFREEKKIDFSSK